MSAYRSCRSRTNRDRDRNRDPDPDPDPEQDLLQSDCHAHDLELLDEPHGVVANGTVAGELKSRGCPHT